MSIENMIEFYAVKYGVRPEFMKAICKVESNFKPDCVSYLGAAGLFQFMPYTAESIGLKIYKNEFYTKAMSAQTKKDKHKNLKLYASSFENFIRLVGFEKAKTIDQRLDRNYCVQSAGSYIKAKQERHGNEALAAAAYFAGSGAVDDYDGIPSYAINYVEKVADKMKGFGRVMTGLKEIEKAKKNRGKPPKKKKEKKKYRTLNKVIREIRKIDRLRKFIFRW